MTGNVQESEAGGSLGGREASLWRDVCGSVGSQIDWERPGGESEQIHRLLPQQAVKVSLRKTTIVSEAAQRRRGGPWFLLTCPPGDQLTAGKDSATTAD